MAQVIPGLVREAYTAGSRHSAGTPTLIKSDVDGDEVDFQWQAVGSSLYTVTARGSLVITGWENCKPRYDYGRFRVACSCPDGARQLHACSSERLYVCKHAGAALESVCDPGAARSLQAEKAARVAKHREEQQRRAAYLQEQRSEQERLLPNERARIEYGLSKRSDGEIANMVKSAAGTVEGLRALATIFPPDVMPPKTSVVCGRCNKTYDPQVQSDLICREEHPYEKVRTEWDGSKKSWSHCRRCDRTFNLDGFHSWGKRGRNEPDDEGDYCYETTHVPIDEFDEENDPILGGLDDGDY